MSGFATGEAMAQAADERVLVAGLFARLWPIMRSITGDGVRQTHDILGEYVALTRHEIPSGSKALDWTVPPEWWVREAYIVAPGGRRFCDIAENTLHLVNYSPGFRGEMSRDELDKQLHSLPDMPDAIPYVTSYYERNWGFCLAHRQRQALPEGTYKVVIDAGHKEGSLTFSEAVLEGETEQEVFITTYTCHPSMANNELSGPLVAALLYRKLAAMKRRRLTYRFAFCPETIGAVCYLNLRGEHLKHNMLAGYVLTCIGDPAPFTMKRSRRGNTAADRAAKLVLCATKGPAPNILEFFPFGSDERQYCSPGFNLPFCVLARSLYATYPQYHTSADDGTFTSPEAMCESADTVFSILMALEENRVWISLAPYGEPQLGPRGLMQGFGAARVRSETIKAIKWLLNLADGENDLLAMVERSGMSLDSLAEAARRCHAAGLIEERK
jgi:aminopeptidase-like protein